MKEKHRQVPYRQLQHIASECRSLSATLCSAGLRAFAVFFFSFSSSLACTAFRGISRETLKLRQQLKRVEECFSPPSPPRFPRTRGRERERFPRLIEARKGAEASRDYTHATRPKQPYGGAKLKHTKRPERPTQSHTLARDYLFLEYITKKSPRDIFLDLQFS
jgi:hypothetical protein